ncbi:MAG: DUF3576 domain-containing protein [Commensalibacter sp.]
MPINTLPALSFTRLFMITSALTLGLTACSGEKKQADNLAIPQQHLVGVDRSATGGDDGLHGGVNAYLWRASIDTLSFMPFLSADAVGGTIITDWYQPVSTNDERFKITCYILGRHLRSDAINLKIFRQVKQNGQWFDAPIGSHTASDITSKILVRARQLRADKA